MEDSELCNGDKLQSLVDEMITQQFEQVTETSRVLDKDERLLPVHFLPEGQKCYDWINKDLNSSETASHPRNNSSGSTVENTSCIGSDVKEYLEENKYFDICLCGNLETNLSAVIRKLIKHLNNNSINLPSFCITRLVDESACRRCDKKVITEPKLGTLLLDAAEHGECDLVRDILFHLPHLKVFKDEDGYTALHRASYNGHLNVVSCLIKEFNVDISLETEDGWTPLHCASRWNQLYIAELLLESGADINAQTAGGLSALHLVSTAPDRVKLLEMLLLHEKINPNLVNNSGETAYNIALRSGQHYKLFELVDESINVKIPS